MYLVTIDVLIAHRRASDDSEIPSSLAKTLRMKMLSLLGRHASVTAYPTITAFTGRNGLPVRDRGMRYECRVKTPEEVEAMKELASRLAVIAHQETVTMTVADAPVQHRIAAKQLAWKD